jgi:predicted DNA-binding transcriptional regulator YafY
VPDTALDRVERLLQILPHAARHADGIGYEQLASLLGMDRRRLVQDLTELSDREFYLDPGTATDIQVGLEPDRVRVWTTGQFRRPVRLSPAEAAALDLGLRVLAAEREEPGLCDRMKDLLRRVARTLPDTAADDPGGAPEPGLAVDGDPAAGDALRALVIAAAARHRPVRVRYLKADEQSPRERVVEPYAVACAEGRWYVIGRCVERDDVRIFRLDRILHAVTGEESFDPPADFDPSTYVRGGRVYRALDEAQVVVRYGGRVAPWLLERGEGEPDGTGGVLVRHQVADPGWIVRHVLQYGAEARVVEPAWAGVAVQEAARRIESADALDAG